VTATMDRESVVIESNERRPPMPHRGRDNERPTAVN
jgi:hypothetical protein